MHAGLNAVIYNVFEMVCGRAHNDDIARREMKERVRVGEKKRRRERKEEKQRKRKKEDATVERKRERVK